MIEVPNLETTHGYSKYKDYLSYKFGSVEAEFYLRDFNLLAELQDLPEGSRVIDIGCGVDARAVIQLQQQFPEYHFIGVNPTFEDEALQNSPISLLSITAEELAETLPHGSTSLIMARNLFHHLSFFQHDSRYPVFKALPTKILQSVHHILETEGKFLVYDYAPGMPASYQMTARAAQNAGFAVECGDSLYDISAPSERPMEYMRFMKK
ncbi:hypothetical protein BH09PAT2_BH09PAT2_09620 [soil metagenome]